MDHTIAISHQPFRAGSLMSRATTLNISTGLADPVTIWQENDGHAADRLEQAQEPTKAWSRWKVASNHLHLPVV